MELIILTVKYLRGSDFFFYCLNFYFSFKAVIPVEELTGGGRAAVGHYRRRLISLPLVKTSIYRVTRLIDHKYRPEENHRNLNPKTPTKIFSSNPSSLILHIKIFINIH